MCPARTINTVDKAKIMVQTKWDMISQMQQMVGTTMISNRGTHQGLSVIQTHNPKFTDTHPAQANGPTYILPNAYSCV
jgi:hypothetical protein